MLNSKATPTYSALSSPATQQTCASEKPVLSTLAMGPTGKNPKERTRQFMLRVCKSNCCQLHLSMMND